MACLLLPFSAEAKHDHFKVSVYVRAQEVNKMKDTQWLESSWATISSQLDVDKIYLETHRDMVMESMPVPVPQSRTRVLSRKE